MSDVWRVTAADESYGHQRVAPAIETDHVHPAWAERCWHLVNLGGGWTLGVGRAVWPHGGKRTAKAGLNTGRIQHSRRVEAPFALGDDPNDPQVGGIRIETVRPLEEVRLTLDDDELAFGFDLTYRGRFTPVATARNRIEREGEVVTDYMNFFQPGVYDGVVRADGEERRIEGRLGFRDRGWGLRKHEGPSRRGMHIFCGAELPDESLYLILYETASGKRVFTNGWLMQAGGHVEGVATVEHDLTFDGVRLVGGTIHAGLFGGGSRELEVEAEGRLWMEMVGYTSLPERAAPGGERLDLSDPALAAATTGFYDNAVRFRCGGVAAHGYVEVGLGTHVRYRPDDA